MLKQEPEERSLPTWHTPTQTVQESAANITTASVSRLDAEEILQLAARMQSIEQDRLSVSELEAIAAERGIPLRFVQQALRKQNSSQSQASSALVLPRMHLMLHQWRVLSVSLPLYLVFLIAVPYYIPALSAAMIVLPFLLCFGLG